MVPTCGSQSASNRGGGSGTSPDLPCVMLRVASSSGRKEELDVQVPPMVDEDTGQRSKPSTRHLLKHSFPTLFQLVPDINPALQCAGASGTKVIQNPNSSTAKIPRVKIQRGRGPEGARRTERASRIHILRWPGDDWLRSGRQADLVTVSWCGPSLPLVCTSY